MGHRILTFNVDFCFNTGKVDEPTLKIVEINPDNLSRYTVAQKVGYYPRQKRLLNILRRAAAKNIKVWFLYNQNFHAQPDKAQRWGVDSLEKLESENYFPATRAGITDLSQKISESTGESYIVLLSVYLIENFHSRLYSDHGMVSIQSDLRDLFESAQQKNIAIIGHDSTLDFIANDKFLTSQILPDEYQPRSVLLLNGDTPESLVEQIKSSLDTCDIVIKPVNEHSGIGVCGINGEISLLDFFRHMHNANTEVLLSLLRLDFDEKKLIDYWIDTRRNEPLIYCQEHVQGDTTDDHRKITYRAVVTAYIGTDDTIEVDIECIYPKKSDKNDFISRVHNSIAHAEIDSAMQNSRLNEQLRTAITLFITGLINYDENDTLARLAGGTDAELLKSIELSLRQGSTKKHSISPVHIDRCKKSATDLFMRSYQAYWNVFPILQLAEAEFPLDVSHLENSIKHKFSYIPTEIITDTFLLVMPILTGQQKTQAVSTGYFSDNRLTLVFEFMVCCRFAFTYLQNKNLCKSNLLKEHGIYHCVEHILSYANTLVSLKEYNLQLLVAINLFELRNILTPEYTQILPILRIVINSTDPFIMLIQDLDTIDSHIGDAHKSVSRIEERHLCNAAIQLSRLSSDNLPFVLSVNQTRHLPDFLLLILNTLYMQYKKSESRQPKKDDYTFEVKIKAIFTLWFSYEVKSPTEPKSEARRWQQTSMATRLLVNFDEKHDETVYFNSLTDFMETFISQSQSKFHFYKLVDLINLILDFQIVPDKITDLFSSLERFAHQLDQEKGEAPATPIVEQIVRRVTASPATSHLLFSTPRALQSLTTDKSPEASLSSQGDGDLVLAGDAQTSSTFRIT